MLKIIPEGVAASGFVGPYDRKALYNIDEVLSQIGEHDVDFDGDLIRMGSQRYQVFRESLECDNCGLIGCFMAKERAAKTMKPPGEPRYQVAIDEPYHFNLYALRAFDPSSPLRRLDVLMTKDHIIPRSKGGPDELHNYRTLCTHCNGKRGNKDELRPPHHVRGASHSRRAYGV